MELEKIELYNFRNYKSASISFDSGLNVICGENAQGKTNLLEAIYFCVVGKSFRATREREVINMQSDIAKIKVFIKKNVGKSIIEIIFSRKEKKTVKIDGIPIKRLSGLLGEFNGVFFAPDELKLIKESPEDRRRFMDIDISQTTKQYVYILSRYNEILANRNKQLKQNISRHDLENIISIWDEQLADYAQKIKKYRQNFVISLLPYAKKAHEFITDGKEDLRVEYVTIKEDTKEEIINKLKTNLEKDIALGYTTYGVHRDDIKVTINGVDVRSYGSQGQQRTAALSLKLAELSIIEEITHTRPVLLLDDVLSELDDSRKKRLLKYCQGTQTFITCTAFNYPDIKCNKIEIKNGEWSKIEQSQSV